MDELTKKYLQDKYGEQLGNINTGQAFANLGDVIAGQKVGSNSPFFTEQRALAKDQTLGDYDREQARLLKEAQQKQMLQLHLMDLAQKKSEGELNRDVKTSENEANRELKKLMSDSQLAAKKQKADDLSSAQAKQLGLAEMGNLANKQYQTALDTGYDPTSYKNKLDTVSWAPQFFKSDEGKKAVAAQDSWIETYLRDASGAAIAPSERGAYADIYFARPGDTVEQVANKTALRNQKEKIALIGAGSKGQEKFATQTMQAKQQSTQQRIPVKKQYSPGRDQTKIIYSDGTEEVVDGKQ